MPSGYFERLPESITQKLTVSDAAILSKIPKTSIFQVPTGYFTELPLQIQAEIARLNGLNPETLVKESIFEIPADYFQTLHQTIQEKILIWQKTNVLSTEQENIFQTPAMYFEGLAAEIAQKTTESASFHLTDLEKPLHYTIPEGYFEDLPQMIQKRIQEKGKLKAPFFASEARWVMAISVVLLLIFGIWWNLPQESPADRIAAKKPIKQEKTPEKDKQKPQNDDANVISLLADSQDMLNQVAGFITQEYELWQNYVHTHKLSPAPKIIQQTLTESSKRDILAYLEQTELSQEDLIEVYISDEQAAASNELAELLEADDLHQLSDNELNNLNELFTKPTKEKKEETKEK